MGAFEEAVASWRNQTFPPGSKVDSLDELHADLVLADTWVADAVIPFVEHGFVAPVVVDIVGETRDLLRRATELARDSAGEDLHTAKAYGEYAALLLRVYEAFLACASSQT